MIAAQNDIPIIIPAQKTIVEEVIIRPSMTAPGMSRTEAASRKDLQQDIELNLGSPKNMSRTIQARPQTSQQTSYD